VWWPANTPEQLGLQVCTTLRLLSDAWCSAPLLLVVDGSSVVFESSGAAHPEQAWNLRPHSAADVTAGLISVTDTPILRLLWALVGRAWREDNPGLEQALTAFDRSWSYRPIDAAECTAELVRGLEALFVYETEEVSYRLGLRCACLLSDDLPARTSIRAELKAAYDVRSRVVHGSPIPNTVKIQGQRLELDEFVPRLRQTARMAICSFLLLLSRFREGTIKRELLDEHVLAGRGSRVWKVLASPLARRLLGRVAAPTPATPFPPPGAGSPRGRPTPRQ
jgi:hypothetical protein